MSNIPEIFAAMNEGVTGKDGKKLQRKFKVSIRFFLKPIIINSRFEPEKRVFILNDKVLGYVIIFCGVQR